MESEVKEADNGTNNMDHNINENIGLMAIDLVLPGGFEGLSELGSMETADLGEDWVSLFFDESYLNAVTTDGEVEPPFYQEIVDATATTPAPDSGGSQLLTHSTMILSSDPPRASSGCPSYSTDVGICPDIVDANDETSLPSSSAAEAVSTSGIQDIFPPTRPTVSRESTLTEASGGSSSDVQPNWWGNEDPEEDGRLHPENGSEEESSTCSFDTSIPSAEAGVPVTNNTAPTQAEDVRSGAEPSSSVGKIAAAGRSNGERSDRKRRSWERGEVENAQQQSCSQSEIDFADEADKDEDEEKRQARLMRNRESAQLSRQRKKVYVDELEGRLRTMVATIAELNATVSHLTAENVNLRRQLGFFYQPSRPGGGMPMMPYPGMISARPVYPGAPMPPVPIPRLKSQQTLTKTPKRSRSTKEPGEKKKAKKVASLATVGVMGLLCVTMLLGPFGDWGSNSARFGTTHIHVGNAQIRVGGRVLRSWNEESESLRNMTRREHWADGGRVPWADGGGEYIGNAGAGTRNGFSGKVRSRSERRSGNVLRRNSTAGSERERQSCADCYSRQEESRPAQNFGEKFVATNVSEQVSLIVPRNNNRLIKVDGNLIIRAVMAGDKAAQDSGKDEASNATGDKGRGQTKQDSSRSSRSPPTPADHQLIKAISTQAQEGGGIVVGQRKSKTVGALGEGNDVQKPAYRSDSLAPSVSATPTFSQIVSGSLAVLKRGKSSLQAAVKEIHEIPRENQRAFHVTQTTLCGRTRPFSEPIVGSFQQWVLDAYYAGPVLSTGMCTEVFRFETSPAGGQENEDTSRAPSSVVDDQVDAVRERNNLTKTSGPSTHKKRDPYAVPLPPIRRKDGNGTEPVVDKVFQEQQPQSKVPDDSTLVVSVFTGRHDTAEESRSGSSAAKGLSQIFVVVLVDSVRYITYSCMLPPTGSQVHVVAS